MVELVHIKSSMHKPKSSMHKPMQFYLLYGLFARYDEIYHLNFFLKKL